MEGEIWFDNDVKLRVLEVVRFDVTPSRIGRYGYEVWQGESKLYGYDSHPHPHDTSLADTHPHHKHIPPNIKHHRIPAPALSFRRPNLSVLIREIEALVESIGDESEE